MPYIPPDSKLIAFSFTGVYTPPDSKLIGIGLIPPPTGSTQVVYPSEVIITEYGGPTVTQTPAIAPVGIASTVVFGTATVANLSQGVTASGHDSAEYGTPPKVWLFHTFWRLPTHDEATLWGDTHIRNQKTYLYPAPTDSALFGGVGIETQHRPIFPAGGDQVIFGDARTAAQWQFVAPVSAKHSFVNEADFQLKTRYLLPPGTEGQQFGTTGIRYLTTTVAPAGFDAATVPIPGVTDRAQHIYTNTVDVSALFGDQPRVWNYNTVVVPDSTDHAYFQAFQPTVENFDKNVYPAVLLATRYGSAQLSNKAVAVPVVGFDSAIFGVADVTGYTQYKAVDGFSTGAYGLVYVAKVQEVAHPTGSDFMLFGSPMAAERQRVCYVDSVSPPLDDTEPWISYRVRTFGRYGGIKGFIAGTPEITDGVRHIYPPAFFPATFGTTRVDLARRTLEPTGIFFPTPAAAFGTPRLSPFIQAITPLGLNTMAVGLPAIARNEIALDFITAGDQQLFGATQVDLARRTVTMLGADQFIPGDAPTVWNWRQYVTNTSQVMPDVIGTLTIELRNKTLRMVGYDSARVSNYADISNNARLMGPSGDDLSRFGLTMVADRVRTLRPDGYDASAFGYWFVVYNYRQAIETSGIPRPYAGVPKVWRNEQVTDNLGCGMTAQFGVVMVAPRIRTVAEYPFADPVAGFPYVGLLTQYIRPPGMTGAFGWTFVEEHFTVFRPFGTNYLRFGDALVRNNTPEIHLVGMDSPPLPAPPWVSFRVRYIDLAGQAPGEYQPNRPEVAFKDRIIYPRGYEQHIIPRTHDIRWDMPQLPAHSIVEPYGIPPGEISRANINTSILFPDTATQTKFGTVELTNMGIWVNSTQGYFLGFGYPEVTPRNRTIQISTSKNPNVFEPSNVVIFPLVIFIDFAIYPNPLMDKELADIDDPLRRPFFGEPTISNQHRAIYPRGLAFGAQGIPEVRTNHLYIEGWDSSEGRWGLTDFAGPNYVSPYWGRSTEDYIPEVPAYNFDTAEYGAPEVTSPITPPVWSPYIFAAGRNSAEFGNTFVENFNRAIYPASVADPEYQVPIPWLHPPFHLWPEGTDMSILPQPMTAFRIRNVYPEGDNFEAVCQEEAETIAVRMRVKHGTSRYAMEGIAPGPFGDTLVADRIRTIYPLTAGAGTTQPARVWPQNIVVPAGHDSAAVGTVRRAVFGELYPYAPDMMLSGYVKVNRRFSATGIAVPTMADPRMARPIRPTGHDQAGYESPAVTNPYGCRDRVIIATGNTDFSTFGVNHVTQ